MTKTHLTSDHTFIKRDIYCKNTGVRTSYVRVEFRHSTQDKKVIFYWFQTSLKLCTPIPEEISQKHLRYEFSIIEAFLSQGYEYMVDHSIESLERHEEWCRKNPYII